MTQNEMVLSAFALFFLGCFVFECFGWLHCRRRLAWKEEETKHWFDNYHIAATRLAAFERGGDCRSAERMRSLIMYADDAGWSRWVHPWPGYQFECCDCGLIHLLQFQIAERIVWDGDPLNEGECDQQVIIFRAKRAEHPDLTRSAPDTATPWTLRPAEAPDAPWLQPAIETRDLAVRFERYRISVNGCVWMEPGLSQAYGYARVLPSEVEKAARFGWRHIKDEAPHAVIVRSVEEARRHGDCT